MSNAYVIGHITVKDQKKWDEYRDKVPASDLFRRALKKTPGKRGEHPLKLPPPSGPLSH